MLACPTSTTLYVDSSKSGVSGDGSSWANAYKELRAAFATAAQCSNINTILVAKGTYKPAAGTDKDSTFGIYRGGLKIYGGYAPGGSSRNINNYPTVLSGNIGNQGSTSDNSYHVMVILGLGSSADSVVMDGLRITAGNAKGSGYSPYDGTPQANGGGINLALNSGAERKIAVRNCIFSANNADYGGGLLIEESSPFITNCTFTLNNAPNGGGICNAYSSSPAITNCIFTSNTASFGGGIINFDSSKPSITNCTLNANSAAYGGAISTQASSPSITNCIIWGNSSGIAVLSGTAVVTYSDVQDGYPGTGNINADPRFVNPADPDGPDNRFATADDGLRLQPASPAINKGRNDSIPANTPTDVTGSARIQQGTVDMGAYESPYPTPVFLSVSDVSHAEGNSGTTVYTFTVSLSDPAPAGGAGFTIATADSTATAPADYTARAAAIRSIAAGASSDTFNVSVKGDLLIEPNEYFKVKVSNASGTGIIVTDSIGVGTITNDDACAAGATLYVDSSRGSSGNGNSWATAYKELREALTIAAQCDGVDTILVAKGTYKPTDDNNRDSAFTILSGGLKLYGGYPSGGGTRNVTANPTVLSGDIRTQNDTSDNSYHVMVIAGLGSGADSVVVDGFTFTKGNAHGIGISKSYNGVAVPGNSGGGITLNGNNGAAKKIVLRGCVFSTNYADLFGAGISNNSSSPFITNCLFNTNRANYAGGGITNNTSSSPLITNCLFNTNRATFGGGMLNLSSSSPVITSCTFSADTAVYGGGIFNQNSSPAITGCIFSTNQVTNTGGGITNGRSSPAITNCTFSANKSGASGGGMYNQDSSAPVVTNCVFSTNKANSNGGGMTNNNSSPRITNCTFSADTASIGGGILNFSSSSPIIANCIIWGNSSGIKDSSSTPVVSYSDVQQTTGVYPGAGNINADPLFVNPADPDGTDNRFATSDDGLELKPNSPAINKGRNDSIPAGITTDITGAQRIQQGTVDMGAYESPYINVCDADSIPPTIIPKNITVYLNASGQASIQPFDVIQSVTDNCQLDSASIRISQSQFTCADVGDSTTAPITHLAYVASTSTGNQAYGGELGMEFSVNKRITVNQLGAFDHQSNGITGAVSGGIRVAIFNKATQQIVPGLDAIVIGDADGFASNHRLRNITPVQLLPGNYVVVAKGYNANELNGNSGLGSPVVFGDNAAGAISYTGSGLYGTEGSGFSYPQNPDAGPANRYLAGTFSFSVDSTTPPATAHQAYTASTSTGVQAYGGELGMAFQVNTSAGITISRLGAFDHQGNGINGSVNGGIRVAIFNQVTQQIVPGLDAIITGQGNAYSANHRFVNITPVSLPAGNYLVVAKGYNSQELNGNSGFGTPPAGTDDASGAIAYTGGGFYGSEGPGFNYPQNTDGGPATRYLAGSFIYAVNNGNSIAAAPVTGRRNSNGVAAITNSEAASTHQAYTASTSTGVQSYGGELGMEFRVNNPSGIVINQLGAFDHQGNGITGTQNGGIRVAIFNKASRSIVAGLDATVSGQGDAYASNHRLKNITPVTLLPGDYVVVAKGYNASELNGNAGFGTPPAGTDDAGGAITYTGSGLYGNEGAGFSYPQNPDGGPATRYLAGTFTYSVVAGAGSRTVTITASDKKGNTSMATAQVTVRDTLGACSHSSAAAAMLQTQTTADVEVGSAIRLYPNPARDRFTLQLGGMKGTRATIEVLDINGRVLEQRSVGFAGKASSQTQVFSLSAQPSGVYFVRVRSEEGLKTLKVIVAR